MSRKLVKTLFLSAFIALTRPCEIPRISSAFRCPFYDNAVMKYSVPSIRKFYFNSYTSLPDNLTESRDGHVYIFPTGMPDCEAAVSDFEFCYIDKTNNKSRSSKNKIVFDIKSLHYDTREDRRISFVTKSSLSVRSVSSSHCRSMAMDTRRICCGVFTPTSPFFLASFAGVSVANNHNLLLFKNNGVQPRFLTQTYMLASGSFDTIENPLFCNEYVQEGLFILRFILGNNSCFRSCSSDPAVTIPMGVLPVVNDTSTSYNAITTTLNDMNATTGPTNIVLMLAILGGSVGTFVTVSLVFFFFCVVCFTKRHCISSSSRIKTQTDAPANIDFKEELAVPESQLPAASGQDVAYAEVGPTTNTANAVYFTLEPPQDYEHDYMVPAEDEQGLYAQLQDMTQAPTRASVKLGGLIGSGQFGSVYKGSWLSKDNSVEVAVKTLKEGANKEDKVKFLQEAAIMGQFRHSNIVAMHGIITDSEPILLILELLEKGDLRAHLIASRLVSGEPLEIDAHCLLSYCRQVAAGMVYLSMKGFVHRDLAARNILISEDGICKIADFGMSRDLADENYYTSHGGMIPVKWTAPEALYYRRYSTASDVWSYGVVLYEIWSLGHKPFEDFDNSEVLKIVDSGYRLPPPPGCPRSIYTIMINCWELGSSSRPTFESISQQLCKSDLQLLKWTKEDSSVHPDATRLGADLVNSQGLYEDLQLAYKN